MKGGFSLLTRRLWQRSGIGALRKIAVRKREGAAIRGPVLTPVNHSVGKAFTILRTIAAGGRDMTATEIAQAIGLNHATVHRFLLTLEGEGALMRTKGGRFQLGHALAELGSHVSSCSLLEDAVRPHLDALASEFREAIHCVVRSGNQAVNTACSLPDRALVINQAIGEPFPLHCTAAGKLFLAGMSQPHKHSFMENESLQQYTANTITRPNDLERELERVAAAGYAIDQEEWEEGLRSVAVPLHNKGTIVAAIALSAPASRLTDAVVERAILAMRDRAASIERALFTEAKVFSGRAKPAGSFPHLKMANDFIFISGTTARRPDDSFEGVVEQPDGHVTIDIRKQTKFIFDAISDMLESVGASLSDLVDIQVFLRDVADYEAFNEAYAQFFDFDGPARTTVGVGQLTHRHQGMIVRSTAYKRE